MGTNFLFIKLENIILSMVATKKINKKKKKKKNSSLFHHSLYCKQLSRVKKKTADLRYDYSHFLYFFVLFFLNYKHIQRINITVN